MGFLIDLRGSALQSYDELNKIRVSLIAEDKEYEAIGTQEMMDRVFAKYVDLQYAIKAIEEAYKRDFIYTPSVG